MTRIHLALIGGLVAVAVGAGVWAAVSLSGMRASSGGGDAAVPIGGPFSLVGETGETVTEQDFAGRYMLLYFGYTYCPDVCPTGLAVMTSAYDQLDPALRDEIAPVFVTVDPERDTVDVVAEYTELFHEDLFGLTGSRDAIDAALKTFRVYAKRAAGGGDDDYLVDHSTFTYLIDRQGHYLAHFNHGITPEEMASSIAEKTG